MMVHERLLLYITWLLVVPIWCLGAEKSQECRTTNIAEGDDVDTCSSSSASLSIIIPQQHGPDSSIDNDRNPSFAATDKDQPSPPPQQPQPQPLYPCTQDFLKDFWYDEPVDGYHVACLTRRRISQRNPAKEHVKDQQQDDHNHAAADETPPSDEEFYLELTLYPQGVAHNEWIVNSTNGYGKEQPKPQNRRRAQRTTRNRRRDWRLLMTALQDKLAMQRIRKAERAYNIKNNNIKIKTKFHDDDDDEMSFFQPWAIYSPNGTRLVDADDERYATDIIRELLQAQVLLIYHGGQFIWPGIRVGYQRNIEIHDNVENEKDSDEPNRHAPNNKNKNQNVTLETMSLDPLVFSIQGFLSDDECSYIQQKAEPTLAASEVTLSDADVDTHRKATDFRTSQSTFLPSSQEDKILQALDQRVASLTRIPRQHQEHVQVLRYRHLERYDHHHDYFDPVLYQNDAATLQSIRHNGRRNRLATVFWYLSTVPHGGETIFPHALGGHPVSNQDCSTGLRVKPERGKVILFYSLTHTGAMDPHSLHGSCPVLEEGAVKYAANKWIWNESMKYVQ